MVEGTCTLKSADRQHLTRRNVLHGTAAAAVVALPAGGAMALALPADAGMVDDAPLVDGLPVGTVDPGLAQLEAGYDRWHAMLAQRDALERREDEARERAGDRVPAHPDPKPEPQDADVAKLWHGPYSFLDEARDPESFISIPQDLLDRFDAFYAEHKRWRDREPRPAADDPDLLLAKRLERQKELLYRKAERYRRKLLKIPTTSPRGLLLKLAIATDTTRLEDFDKRFRRPFYYGTFDGAEHLMPPLLADLRAMVVGGVA